MLKEPCLNPAACWALAALLALGCRPPWPGHPAPDALVKQISTEVLDAAKADKAIQAGDVNKVIALVDAKVMPHVNFEVMTRSAVGPQWRSATPEQRNRCRPSSRPCWCACTPAR
jgi:phospholipid transport system substrate-binding protein